MFRKRMSQATTTRAERLRESMRAFQFKTVHERYASDDYWEKWRFIYENLGRELKRRKRIQLLARREKDDFKFCKTIAPYAKDWCGFPNIKWPESFVPLNVRGYRDLIRLTPDVLLHPEIYCDSWDSVPKGSDPSWRSFIDQFSKAAKWLGALPPGAKPLVSTIKIRRIARAARARGRHLSHRDIAKLGAGKKRWAAAPSWSKQDAIQEVKDALRVR
jgi:hypothetical protein